MCVIVDDSGIFLIDSGYIESHIRRLFRIFWHPFGEYGDLYGISLTSTQIKNRHKDERDDFFAVISPQAF